MLLPLVIILAMSGYLVTNAPEIVSTGVKAGWLSKDHRSVIFYDEIVHAQPKRTETDFAIIDLDSGATHSIRMPPGHLLSAALDQQGNVVELQHPLDSTQASLNRESVQLVFVDFTTRQVRLAKDIGYPPVSYFRLCAGRYLLGLHDGQIHVLDTHNVERGAHSISAGPNPSYVVELKQSRRFYVVHEQQINAGQPPTATLELFEIDDQGQPRQIASWPAGVTGRPGQTWACTAHNEDHILSLSPDRSRIELHSVLDGALVSSYSVPELDWNSSNWRFVLRVIEVESSGEFRCFDLERREWLRAPGGTYRIFHVSEDRDYYFYRSVNGVTRFKVYSRLEDQFISEFESADRAEVFRLDEDRFVETSNRYGECVRIIDANTGKTVREIKPLAWIVYLLIAVLILYAAWCAAWMIVSARTGGWAWVDVLVVVGIPCLVLLMRVVIGGDRLNLNRIPTRHALCGVMAAEMLAAVWIVFGATRLTLRIVPLMVLVAFFLALLTGVFYEAPWIVWYASTCAVVPAVCLTFLLGLFRVLGLRLFHDPSHSSLRPVDRSFGRSKFPLRDLILLTVVAALLFATTRPVSDSVGRILQMDSFLIRPLMFSVLGGCWAVFVALQRRRWLFTVGIGLAIAGTVPLVWEPISAFAQGRSTTLGMDRYHLHAATACVVALFVGLIPYRLRGWSLSRYPLD
jgi:hypothetical protein